MLTINSLSPSSFEIMRLFTLFLNFGDFHFCKLCIQSETFNNYGTISNFYH